MFYSNKEKILFIAAPKTGSTSIEEKLAELISDGTRFRIETEEGISITSADVASPSLGHAKACEFQSALGPNIYDQLRVFGFVRDPIEKLVSSYFFSRSLPLTSAFKIRTEKRRMPMVVKQLAAILMARLLPLWIWAIFYQMRNCYSYFTDDSGEVIVDFLGATSRLSSDFSRIAEHLGHDVKSSSVPRSNVSRHREPTDYWFFRFFIPMLKRRYGRDSELFSLVEHGVWVNQARVRDAGSFST